MKVLFVTEQFCDCNPAAGVSNSYWYYIETWRQLGLGEYSVCHYDCRPAEQAFDEVHREAARFEPGVVLFTECWGHTHPIIHGLWSEFAARHIPVIAVWHDTAKVGAQDLDGVRLNVIVDVPQVRFPLRNGMALWVPINTEMFHPEEPRDIDILYASGRSNKTLPAQWIQASGLPVTWRAGQREEHLPMQEYAALYRRAKICVNFAQDNEGSAPQVKCRVWETLAAGALLLEQRNTETPGWLRPGVDYVEFSNPIELADRARYYLKHDDERRKIASSGYQQFNQRYSPALWWNVALAWSGKPL